MAPKKVKAVAKPAAKPATKALAATKPTAKRAAKPAKPAPAAPALDLASLRAGLDKEALALVDGPELPRAVARLFEQHDHGGPDGCATGALAGPWLARCVAKLVAPERKHALGPALAAKLGDGVTEPQLLELAQWVVAAEAQHYFAEGPGGEEALRKALDELCGHYDAPGDGRIERASFLEAEERLHGFLEGQKQTLSTKERRALVEWFKSLKPEGTVSDGLYVSFEQFKAHFPQRLAAREPEHVDAQLRPLRPETHPQRFAEFLALRVLEPFRALRPAKAAPAEPELAPAPPPVQHYPQQVPLRDLKGAIEAATPHGWYDHRRTVLLAAGGGKGTETFLMYSEMIMVDCKELLGKLYVQKTSTKEEVRAFLRSKLKYCLCTDYHDCRPLWFRFANTAFALQDFIGPDGLPASVFEPGFTPQKALEEGLISEMHKKQMDEHPKTFGEFKVVISSDFDLAGVAEHLQELPGAGRHALLEVVE